MIIASIESILVTNLFPAFLSVTQEIGYIHVIIAHRSFDSMSISERYTMVSQYTDFLCYTPIIIECFSSDEMEELIENLF